MNVLCDSLLLNSADSKIMTKTKNLKVFSLTTLSIGFAAFTALPAQANLTYVFPDEAIPIFNDGGVILPGSSWVAVNNEFDLEIINWNILTTRGGSLIGALYTPENSIIENQFNAADAGGSILLTESSFLISNDERQLTLNSFEFFVIEEQLDESVDRFSLDFFELELSSQDNPVLPNPDGVEDGSFFFSNVPTGAWSDPVLASGYTYTIDTPGSLFTEIAGFPTGFAAPFTLSVGDTILGTFEPGDNFIFPNGGVESFTISGITPPGLSDDPTAFPIQLAFNTPSASFTQTAITVPEPNTILGLSLLSFGGLLTRRSKQEQDSRNI